LTASLRALVSNLIDYAGLYPPAELPLDEVLERYRRYLAGPDSWILNRLVLPASSLHKVRLEAGWRITLLVDTDPGSLPLQVETTEGGQANARQSARACPTYLESPLSQITNSYAKIRTGGLTPESIPTAQHVAEFLHAAAQRKLPFKATAGLHHAIRAEHPLTYASNAPRALMHGFLNVFTAAAFAWFGAPDFVLIEILEERNPRAFEFHDDKLLWRGNELTPAQIEAARRDLAHSFGSCSFEEAVADLRQLGLLS
jgi:hypothetical protein